MSETVRWSDPDTFHSLIVSRIFYIKNDNYFIVYIYLDSRKFLKRPSKFGHKKVKTNADNLIATILYIYMDIERDATRFVWQQRLQN